MVPSCLDPDSQGVEGVEEGFGSFLVDDIDPIRSGFWKRESRNLREGVEAGDLPVNDADLRGFLRRAGWRVIATQH